MGALTIAIVLVLWPVIARAEPVRRVHEAGVEPVAAGGG